MKKPRGYRPYNGLCACGAAVARHCRLDCGFSRRCLVHPLVSGRRSARCWCRRPQHLRRLSVGKATRTTGAIGSAWELTTSTGVSSPPRADTRKGYLRSDFTDAFHRYLPPDPKHPKHGNGGAELAGHSERRRPAAVSGRGHPQVPRTPAMFRMFRVRTTRIVGRMRCSPRAQADCDPGTPSPQPSSLWMANSAATPACSWGAHRRRGPCL
jgi:hypothetical protein